MPELPEAETIVRTLAPVLVGRTILGAEFFAARVCAGAPPPALAGRMIRAVRRHGKQILVELDQGLLHIRLGMTGSLLLNKVPGPYTRALFRLETGTLCFDDIRQFGSVRWIAGAPDTLGPDPLEITSEEFTLRLRARNSQIKRLLLDQSFLRGLGNIYADEVLFRAGIHPRAHSRRLSRVRAARLHEAIVAVLSLAIEQRGSSISDYVDGEGRPGGFQNFHQVYGKQGEPCSRCGALIRRIVVAQRGTHYCPKCQRC